MCLTFVDKKPKKYKKNTGYKVVRKIDGRHCAPFFGHYYKPRAWNKDTRKAKIPGETGNYPAGFHIFHYKKDAIRWELNVWDSVTRKVEYRKVVATGIQFDRTVIVAREFRFID